MSRLSFLSVFVLSGLITSATAMPLEAGKSMDNMAGRQAHQEWLVQALGTELFGTAYSGFRAGQYPDRGDGAIYPSREEIVQDLDILQDYDLRLIRLYDSGPNTRDVLEVIGELELPFRVVLGIWLKAEISNHDGCPWLHSPIPEEELAANRVQNEREVERGIALAREFSDIVVAVNVGNEALVEWNDHMVSIDRAIDLVREVQSGIDQPVTVAENFDWWRTSGARLGAEVDFLSVHSYPMMHGEGRPVEDALAFTIENVEAVRAAIPDKPISILEAGWATTSGRFPGQANEQNQQRYYRELKQWAYDSMVPVLFFEAFDEPWKGDANDHLETEKHWGLFFENRMPKQAMRDHASSIYSYDAAAVAVNFGGGEYTDPDGIEFVRDPMGSADSKAVEGVIDGTQRGSVFETYREGPLSLSYSLPDGIYDLTLLFVEPDGLGVGERVFDVFAQGRKMISGLDIKRARWGTSAIALERTVTNVLVDKGELKLELKGVRGEPVISGSILRRRVLDEQNWNLVWSDEFDQPGAPDAAKWTHDIWEAGRVNVERQAYTDRPENARIEAGRLIIEAHKENFEGARYTSARLHTRGAMDTRYGRIDIRAKMPTGQGTWAALWLLPSDPYRYANDCSDRDSWQGAGSSCNAWPNSGEIDMVEYVGFEPGTVHGAVHTADSYGGNGVTSSVAMPRVEDEFKVYSLEWNERQMLLRIDGVPFFHYSNLENGWREWPFDHPFHLVFNLAIGGSWGEAGGPVDDSIFPTRMEVDYVRVFKLDGDPG